MNVNESLAVLSDVLLEDERIVSLDEREFLADLLRHSENNPNQSSPEVTRAIARIAGEIVWQRASNLVGDSILRKLVHPNLAAEGAQSEVSRPYQNMQGGKTHLPPKPPTPTPPSPGPKAYGSAQRDHVENGRTRTANPPKPPTPAPPSPGRMHTLGPKGILNPETVQCAEVLPPPCVVLEEFLAPAEVNNLLAYAVSHEDDFVVSEVISPGVTSSSAADFEYRRSQVLMDLGPHHQDIVNRLRATLPRILPKLGIDSFPISRVETQITASRNGDFFRWHSDNAQDEVAARQITFVYFFHREPKAFEGGELRIQGPSGNDPTGGYGNYYTIVPRQNQVVLFDSSLTHEIVPVKCLSGRFTDSRFTVNGWFSR